MGILNSMRILYKMGGACSAYGRAEGRVKLLVGSIREADRWGYPDVDGKIILRWISRKWGVGFGLD